MGCLACHSSLHIFLGELPLPSGPYFGWLPCGWVSPLTGIFCVVVMEFWSVTFTTKTVIDLIMPVLQTLTSHQWALFLVISAHHSGDWLFALPILSCSLKLYDEVARITVGLCPGLTCSTCMSLWYPGWCPWPHGFVCKHAPDRALWQHALIMPLHVPDRQQVSRQHDSSHGRQESAQ